MPQEARFEVSWSRLAIDTLKQHGDSGFARLVRILDERLCSNPLNVGEVYRTRGPLMEHLAVLKAIAIDFAVDTERKFVLVRSCHILSGSGG